MFQIVYVLDGKTIVLEEKFNDFIEAKMVAEKLDADNYFVFPTVVKSINECEGIIDM